jgi:hypothetical protein
LAKSAFNFKTMPLASAGDMRLHNRGNIMIQRLVFAAALVLATPAAAANLISFTDNAPTARYNFGMDAYGRGISVEWTQTGTVHNAALSASIVALIPGTVGAWSLYRHAEGLVASGQYLAPFAAGLNLDDYNSVPMTLVADDLTLTAGTYSLALFGPVSAPGNSALWLGEVEDWTVDLAPGFSTGDIATSSFDPDFGPVFQYADSDGRLSFKLTGHATPSAVPEPAGWAMLIAGFGLTGAMMRRRRGHVRAIAA